MISRVLKAAFPDVASQVSPGPCAHACGSSQCAPSQFLAGAERDLSRHSRDPGERFGSEVEVGSGQCPPSHERMVDRRWWIEEV